MSQERKEVLVTNEYNYFNYYRRYAPDEILEIINEMKKDGISSFEIVDSYGSVNIEYYRLETEEEQAARLKRLAKERALNKKIREEKLIKEAAELGYILEKKQNEQ